MGRNRIIILAVAAVAAIGLALILRAVIGGGSREPVQTVAAPAAAPSTARVLVAARDLPAGTRLTAADLVWRDWPMDGLNVSYIVEGAAAAPRLQPVAATAPPSGEQAEGEEGASDRDEGSAEGVAAAAAAAQAQQTQAQRFMGMLSGNPGGPIAALEGMTVREAILQGEPIVERKLVRAGESGFMAVVLQPGMRAMAIPVSVETAAGGFILPGDHVDVILSRQVQTASGSSGEFSSSTVLRNIRVLAVDQTVTPEANAQTVVGATATLEVGPREAEVLALAKAQGTLALVLRSYADMDAPSGVGSLGGATGARSARPIRVWRSGQATEVAQR